MVFNNDEIKTKVKKEATPYVAGVAVFNIVLMVLILYLIFQVSSIRKQLKMSTP